MFHVNISEIARALKVHKAPKGNRTPSGRG